jgi:hypothetical protein
MHRVLPCPLMSCPILPCSVLCCSVSVDTKVPYHQIVQDATLLITWSIKSRISTSFSYRQTHYFSLPSFKSVSLLSLLSFIQTISLLPLLSPLSLLKRPLSILSEEAKKWWRRRHTAPVTHPYRATWSMGVTWHLQTESVISTEDSLSMQVCDHNFVFVSYTCVCVCV